MDREKIQNRVIQFFRSYSKKPLEVITRDCCSEMSRLVGCWILTEDPSLRALILKGEISKGNFHDILLILNGNYTIIDPTIWQIKKNAKSIFVGEVSDVNRAIELAGEYYGGIWKISEEIKDCNDQKEYESVLEKIITENKSS